MRSFTLLAECTSKDAGAISLSVPLYLTPRAVPRVALNKRVMDEGNGKEGRREHYPESLIENVCSRRRNGQ